MDARLQALLARAEKQAGFLNTRHPICRVCGKSDRRNRFERHHVVARFAGLRLCEVTVLLCRECHDRISDMQNDLPKLNPSINPALALKINRARGQAQLLTLVAEKLNAEADEILAAAILDLRDREDGQ